MTTEEKFHAAVNVIRNLPKNGAYQPSHELKLRFYGFFKQATDGPCSIARPAFWDIIGRSKYDAWKRLGNMSKKEAMENYVEELKKIVETMSYNDNVGMFLGSLGNFYDNVPVEDIEMLLGPVIERMRSQPGSPLQNSPLGSRETSPTRIPRHLVNKSNVSSLETSPLSSMSSSPPPPDTDDEDEEFIDTLETTPHAARKVFKTGAESPLSRTPEATEKTDKSKLNGHIPNGPSRNHNGSAPAQLNGKVTNEESEEEDGFARTKPRDRESPNVSRRRVAKVNGGPKTAYVTDLSEPLREAVLHLQKDLDRITARVRSLEVAMLSQPQSFHEVALCNECDGKLEAEIGAFEESVTVGLRESCSGLPVPAAKKDTIFPDIPRSVLVFIVVWPFFAHFLIKFLQMRRRMKNCKWCLTLAPSQSLPAADSSFSSRNLVVYSKCSSPGKCRCADHEQVQDHFQGSDASEWLVIVLYSIRDAGGGRTDRRRSKERGKTGEKLNVIQWNRTRAFYICFET